MADVAKLAIVPEKISISQQALDHAKWLLKMVEEGKVQELVIVAFGNDDAVWIEHSGTMSVTKTTGALERAKYDILKKAE